MRETVEPAMQRQAGQEPVLPAAAAHTPLQTALDTYRRKHQAE
jgi:hypothetical protein